MNIVIPIAGRGKRFLDAGYTFPKPFIDVNGKSMIQVVVENLNLPGKHIFICQKEHYEKFALKEMLNLVRSGCEIIITEGITEGAAATVLLAKDQINNDDELIIANSDQWIDWNPQHFLSFMRGKGADGGILTFLSSDKKWSFVKLNDEGWVTEVAEKKPISNIATVGIYYFKKGKYFVEAAEEMIRKNIRTNKEFYVAPVYNEMVLVKKRILTYSIKKMMGLGTPTDLNKFLKTYKKN